MKPNSTCNLFVRLLLPFLFLTVFACKKGPDLLDIDAGFSRYIESFTTGTISKTGTIVVKVMPEMGGVRTLGEPAQEDLLSIYPTVKGTTQWLDDRTIEFRPEKELKPGQLYEVTIDLKKIGKVEKGFEQFRFQVQVMEPSYNVQINGLKVQGESRDKMWLSGEIVTADREDSAAVEKILSCSLKSKDLSIQWTHDITGRIHTFKMMDIPRTKTVGTLDISWTGSSINSSKNGSESLEIPAINDYKVMSIKAVNDGGQYIKVQFSAPLLSGTDLRGLISLNASTELSYVFQGSEVFAYPAQNLIGSYTVTVSPGIENIWGEKLQKKYTATINFENRKPFVNLLGKGEIIPSSGKILLPFEAGGLKAVDVTIVKIFSNNLSQFFQVNDYDGDYQLRRVAKPIVQKTIRLDQQPGLNLQVSNRFSIDLEEYFRTEPGAMYRVTIGFRPEYSLYNCNGKIATGYDDEDEGEYEFEEERSSRSLSDEDEENTFWNNYDDYYPFGYNWSQRDNPCHASYFNRERWQARNIIASDIGIIAKRSNDKSMLIATTELGSAQPLSNVSIEVLDYQQQSLFKGMTDAGGILQFQCSGKPYLIIASKGNDRTYLKVNDGNAQLISRFDVSGTEVRQGIKGFIYGERGVWRPGDSLYINFILEDKDKKIPAGHPVEFQLLNPQGQLFYKTISTSGTDGIYSFKTATNTSSPTGDWQAKVKVGGATFDKRIKIETIMPNRLKIDIDWKGLMVWKMNDKPSVDVRSQWLFGAPAQKLAVTVDATLSRKSEPFPAYKNYVFENPEVSFSSETKTILEAKLNDEGVLNFSPALSLEQRAPGMLKAGLLVKVFEPGGAFSSDYGSIDFSPYSRYIGMRSPEQKNFWDYLETGKTYPMDIVALAPDGKPVGGNTKLTARLYKVQWRWWWDESSDEGINYTSGNYSTLMKTEYVQLVNGKGSWKVNIPKAEWGRYFLVVRDSMSGHSTGKLLYFDDPYWKSREGSDDPNSEALLSFNADKASYKVDETVKLTIPSSDQGRLLISIENGRKILQTQWVPTTAGQTTFQFKATKNMAPNVYAHVTFIQPHAQTTNDRPLRMYGIIPIEVKDPQTVLQPKISMADVVRPEQAFTVKISETNGKDMAYTLAIVDEGLLNITRFKTPNPHTAFYAKEALGVKTWDIFDHVIGSFAGKYGRILTIGGDEGLDKSGDANKANRFPPVVRHLGTFQLKKGEIKTHTVKLPPYFGAVRVMVVAAKEGAYGNAEKTATVRNPLMVYVTAPRVLGPEEQVNIPVTIFATEKALKGVQVKLNPGKQLEIIGAATATVDFDKTGEKTIYFKAKVRNVVGKTEISVSASAGGVTSTDKIHLDIRNPNPSVTKVAALEIKSNESATIDISPIGVSAQSTAVLELSSIPSIQLKKRLGYLISYPHGCIEQVTSGAFPQLFLSSLTDLTPEQKAKTETHIKSAIQSLKGYQLADGAFSYWPGMRTPEDWGSLYAGHFLLEAKAKGYFIPDEMLSTWLQYQRNKADKWHVPAQSKGIYYEEIGQAYRLYLLAKAGSPLIGAMNRLKEFQFLSDDSKWRLAMAYKLAGYDKQAADLSRNLPINLSYKDDYGYTYGSASRNKGMVLEALTLLNRRQEARDMVIQIADLLSSNSWMSTQTTAYCLMSVAMYAGANQEVNPVKAVCKINNKDITINSQKMVTQIPVDVSKGKVGINITNQGSGYLFVRAITEGQPLPGEAITQFPSTSNLMMSVEYLDMGGKAIVPSRLQQGKDFVAKVTVVHPGKLTAYKNLALNTIFPSGWEIINTRIWDAASGFSNSPSTYQDIRDDRVYTYFDLPQAKSVTYYFLLNAAYTGKYYLPLMNTEAMYDNTISAGTKGRWVEVVP